MRAAAGALLVLALAPGCIGPVRKAAADEAWHGRMLRACENEEGFPPFTIPGEGGKSSGYSVDLVDSAITGSGMALELAFMPAKRCSSLAASGVLDMVMEDNAASGLDQRFLASDSIYATTYVLLYDRTRFPEGLSPAAILADPASFPGCGMWGEGYGGLPADLLPTQLHLYSSAYAALLSGRCAFFPDQLEHSAVFRLNGAAILDDPRIGWVPGPSDDTTDLPPGPGSSRREKLFLFLRRDFPAGAALIDRINQTIRLWQRTGKDEQVMEHYLGRPVPPPQR
jgi:ABC-type amino acid transport substrate-binding protein